MEKKISMDMIAAELNISKSLVSRALSDKYGVSDEMRNRIKTTAVKMGYKFSSNKKNTLGKDESITMVVERHDLLDSGFWLKIINSIEKELNKRNISVFLSIIENDDESLMPLSIKQMKTNGVLILGLIPLKHIISVSTSGLPIVLVDSHYSNLKFDHVMANNYSGAFEATEILVKNGHKKIGFVGALLYSYSFAERYRGYVDFISECRDLELESFSITNKNDSFYIPFCKEQFINTMKSSQRPTALFCANDVIAFQIYELLLDMGLNVPNEVSVIGFDNNEKSEWVNPALTTVNIPKTSMGERAVELLLNRIEHGDRHHELVLIGTNIVKRNSVCKCK